MQSTLGASAPNLIKTFTGKKISLRDFKKEDVDIVDIARSEAMQCRFAGHISRFYCVAEHSVYCAMMAPKVYGLYFLFHDALETYMQDLTKPNKDELNEMFIDAIEATISCLRPYIDKAIVTDRDFLMTIAGEIPSPYDVTTNKIEKVIFDALGLSYLKYRELKKEIKEVDIHVFNLEVKILRDGLDPKMVIPVGHPLRGQPFGMTWEEAEQFFMNAYSHLSA